MATSKATFECQIVTIGKRGRIDEIVIAKKVVIDGRV